ncbi:MAG: ABC transporter ATP-binding protein [Chloroflexia bacterium]|nr:ABC transporter ATP-binding protein [Chloroflexia bacterium]
MVASTSPDPNAARPDGGDALAEFTVAGQPEYDQRSPTRWILSHILRFRVLLAAFVVGSLAASLLNGAIPGITGDAFDEVLYGTGDRQAALLRISLVLLGIVMLRGVFDVVARYTIEVMAKRLERDSRIELFTSLLGKSQTFHNRQQVGDLMARSTNDVRQLGFMLSPGLDLIIDSMMALVVPFIFIALIDVRLLLVPALFAIGFFITLRLYMRQLAPISDQMRNQFGVMNAGLNEAVHGVEVIKATGQEEQERAKFNRTARLYRDFQVMQGLVQARYLPTLLLPIAIATAILHGVYLVQRGDISIGELIAYLGLLQQLGFPTFISTFSFSMVQMGLASANRILGLMREETELDQNTGGHVAPMKGDIVFDNVTFSYGGDPILKNLSFHAKPGETVAIVGETGSGKSTLTKLVNRIYDVDSGRILIDDVDVRDWNMDSLRSQISFIEQDVTLFSRPVAENIGFSLGQSADREEVVRAARDAQAHEFIVALDEGYDTVIGERGVTLSGGQRQRLAIARALLTSPSVLVLDDSTSAIDSATEDSIQQAIRRILEGRTTLLITHRLSQIRWADKVLLIRKGELVAQGSHAELLDQSRLYRRIFAHYDEMDTPSLDQPETRDAVAAGRGGIGNNQARIAEGQE